MKITIANMLGAETVFEEFEIPEGTMFISIYPTTQRSLFTYLGCTNVYGEGYCSADPVTKDLTLYLNKIDAN